MTMHNLDQPDDAHLDGAAIDRCTLCDADGYRTNAVVCDHVDRTDTVRRGMHAVQAALNGRPKDA